MKQLFVVIVVVLKWLLASLCVIFNSILAWKILRRRYLYTVFNLAMCFYFIWNSLISTFMFYQYGEVVQSMFASSYTSNKENCFWLYISQLLTFQPMKAIFLSIIFR